MIEQGSPQYTISVAKRIAGYKQIRHVKVKRKSVDMVHPNPEYRFEQIAKLVHCAHSNFSLPTHLPRVHIILSKSWGFFSRFMYLPKQEISALSGAIHGISVHLIPVKISPQDVDRNALPHSPEKHNLISSIQWLLGEIYTE